LYGLNTVGAVLGALLGGYVFLEFLNIDQLFKLCIGITLFSGGVAAYSYFLRQDTPRWKVAATGSAFAAVIFMTVLSPAFDKNAFLQPFRQQRPDASYSYKGAKRFREYLGT